MDKDQIERIKFNIREFDQFLGPYPLVPQDKESVNVYHRWLALTSKIDKKVIKKILPQNGRLSAINSISHFSEIKDENKTEEGKENIVNENNKDETNDNNNNNMDVTMTNTENIDNDNNNNDNDTHDTNNNTKYNDIPKDQEKYRLNFTLIDLKKSYPLNATTEEITKYSIDKSYLLKKIIENDYKGDLNLFLGEFQLSYIIFLIGQVYDGFEQWKTMIILMLQCEEALSVYGETLFKDFLVILNDQLKDFPHDFFYDILSGSNFLRSSLKIFYRIIQKADGCYPELQEQLNKLLEHLSKTFKWNLEEEFHETNRLNANIMKEKLNDCLKESSNNPNHLTANELNKNNQLLKLMEELGIEDEEDLPVIVDYDE
ncbi:hypothetical protein BCR32DRAFT_138436 [Anaeromyces robustus]|uniref:AAR2 C-terminal domain-containing protein n=1 Tax=Anaeromyces robustus TaxID=1754192 RepID=A0A1Y1VQP5_9FUNG|nr:hypothetical protein BCR32DRAFT_138436 [Anaeromyces robustus]|eukprot:ORX63609.1 hypothetical protein BCR32DRAFT_138436 [Anaeromyces robustus]